MSSLVSRYELLSKPPGSSAFGNLYRAKDRLTGRIVALKKISLVGQEEGIPTVALREVALLKSIKHANVVDLMDVEHSGDRWYMVMEWVDQDLKRLMFKSADPLPSKQIKSLLYQILKGVEYCHSLGITHRDIRPAHILVNRDGRLKLCDFSLGRALQVPVRAYTQEVVTLWYRPPEILLGQKHYSPAVDMWSVGMVFAELVNKAPFVPGDSQIDEIFKIFQALGTPKEEDWPGVTALPCFKASFPKWPGRSWSKLVPSLDETGIDLLKSLLRYDPAKRISAKAALEHPFFDDVDKSQYAQVVTEASEE